MNKKSLIALSVSAAFTAGVFLANYTEHFSFSKDTNLKPALQQTVADIPTLEKVMAEHQMRMHPMMRPTVTGNYLAGRSAQKNKDWDNAYKYMGKAFELSDVDKANANGVLDRAFLMAITTGDIDQALKYGETIIEKRPDGELAHILKAINFFKNSAYQDADVTLKKIDTDVFGGYAVPLLQAWNHAAAGNAEQAHAALKASDFSDDTAYKLQTALIFDFLGQHDQADLAYRNALQQGLELQETLMVANFFERNQDWETAAKIYTLFNEQEPNNPYLQTALARVTAQQTPAAAITTAAHGMSYTLYKMASLLAERDAADSALIYNRIAEFIGHTNPDAHILMGDLMAQNAHYDEALAYYSHVQPHDILYKTAQMKIVRSLEDAGDHTKALGVLQALQTSTPYAIDALIRTGDIHQRHEQFDLALNAYDKAVSELGDKFSADYWGVLYARGMTYEQMGNWNAAEKDFVKALEYSPDNPALLNVLGYSWIDRGVNLNRAMDMIKQAVQMRPHDGYILDSYGWAFYKIGDYDQASYWLEKAIELHPEDATMNDHLGDAYWQSGRIKEARFQWERAVRLSDDPKMQGDLSRKLKNGIFTESQTDSAAVTEELHPDAL